MPDVFLSYSREDQAIAGRFAEGLGRAGFDVWWDATLRSGEAYDEVTERSLREARAVVVLWSKTSVASRWVRAEATLADRNRTLVPVMIETCDRPIMFELTQSADLSHWKGDERDPVWLALVADVRRYVERAAVGARADTGAASGRAPAQQATARNSLSRAAMLAIGAALLLAAGAAAWWFTRAAPPVAAVATSAPAPAASAAAASVAVVPFANLTGEVDKEYFSDGMAEELITALAKVPGLSVASRTSSFAYKGKSSDIRQIARDLRVATILEGSVRSAGDRVRVTAQLTSAESGYQLWSESYDRKFDDLFKLQDDLAREIVTAFRKTVGANVQEYESSGPPTQDLEAYQLYLKGLAALDRNSDPAAREAVSLFEQAVARDPKFARAYFSMATARSIQTISSVDEVERDAKRGLELDPDHAPYALFGASNARRGNWMEAEEIFRAAANSKEPGTHTSYALGTLWPTGQLRATVREFAEAHRLSPATATTVSNLARAYSAAGNDALSRRYLQESIVMGIDVNGRRTLQANADLALREGRYAEAAELLNRTLSEPMRALKADEVITLVFTAMHDTARRAEAVSALQRLVPRLGPQDWVVKVWAMQWFSLLGALDAAYATGRELQEQFAKQSPVNPWSWLWVPEMRAFRQDARFQAFVTKLKMMPYWEKYGPPDECTLQAAVLTCR